MQEESSTTVTADELLKLKTEVAGLSARVAALSQFNRNTVAGLVQLFQQVSRESEQLECDLCAPAAAPAAPLPQPVAPVAPPQPESAPAVPETSPSPSPMNDYVNRMYHSCLSIPELECYREEWCRQLSSDKPAPHLACMFASLHSWSCMLNLMQSVEKPVQYEQLMITELIAFSRFFLATLAAGGVSASDCVRLSNGVASGINTALRVAAVDCAVEVPAVGVEFDRKSMEPSALGERSGFVQSVVTWAIRSEGMYSKKGLVVLA